MRERVRFYVSATVAIYHILFCYFKAYKQLQYKCDRFFQVSEKYIYNLSSKFA